MYKVHIHAISRFFMEDGTAVPHNIGYDYSKTA